MDKILLGEGVFSIGGTDVGLCRGGGKFTVTREFRKVEADGDMGTIKGRVRLLKADAKLEINHLVIFKTGADEIKKKYPALKTDATGKLTGANTIADSDYNDVKWTGRTDDGKAVIITVENAINLDDIDWALVSGDEVVQKCTYLGCYDPADRTKQPWNVEFVQGV